MWPRALARSKARLPCTTSPYTRPLSVKAFSRPHVASGGGQPGVAWQQLYRQQETLPPWSGCFSLRSYSSSPSETSVSPATPSTPQAESAASRGEATVPSYDLTFTCKPCSTRSTHRISKQGYHNGTVLITCPNCKNRHLISDHLKIFTDKAMTIDKFLEEHGEVVRRGALGPDGDIELWNDTTEKEGRQYLPSDERQSTT